MREVARARSCISAPPRLRPRARAIHSAAAARRDRGNAAAARQRPTHYYYYYTTIERMCIGRPMEIDSGAGMRRAPRSREIERESADARIPELKEERER